jgi:hypothetical protein
MAAIVPLCTRRGRSKNRRSPLNVGRPGFRVDGGGDLERDTDVRSDDAGILTQAWRLEEDILEIEIDVRARGRDLEIGACGAGVCSPGVARLTGLVDAVFRER